MARAGATAIEPAFGCGGSRSRWRSTLSSATMSSRPCRGGVVPPRWPGDPRQGTDEPTGAPFVATAGEPPAASLATRREDRPPRADSRAAPDPGQRCRLETVRPQAALASAAGAFALATSTRAAKARIGHRKIGQDLAIDLNPSGFETGDEAVVRHPFRACCSVDPLDPQLAEVALRARRSR